MVFQGDENADLTPFRFFREFQSIPDENYLYIQKGYREGKSALEESTLGKIKYSKCGKQKMKEFENLTRDLNKLNEQNPAISMGNVDVNSTVNHNLSKVAAFSTKDVKSNNEVFTVANFGDTDYGFDKDNEYYIKFPKGNWVEILNTDSSKYGGTDEYLNKNIINSDGNSNCSINLSGYSTCCFKKID